MRKIIFIIFLIFSLPASAQIEKDTIRLGMEQFAEIPEAFDGCVCTFSSSIDDCRNGKYFFVNDYASYGCVKIDGSIQLLDLVSYNIENKLFVYSKSDITLELRIIDNVTEKDGIYYSVQIKVTSQYSSSEVVLWGRCDC